MAFRVSCPNPKCKKPIQGPSEALGKRFSCPECGHVFVPRGRTANEKAPEAGQRPRSGMDEEDEDEDEGPRLKRKKKGKKAVGRPALLWALVSGGAALAVGIVVLVLVLKPKQNGHAGPGGKDNPHSKKEKDTDPDKKKSPYAKRKDSLSSPNDTYEVALPDGEKLLIMRIPAKGKTFWMSEDNKNAQKQETLNEDYFLGKYMVTQAQWKALMGNNPSSFVRPSGTVRDVSDLDLKSFPVESIDYLQVEKFIEKLNAREKVNGWVYRLPTEVEWEFACRGGVTSQQDCSFDYYFATPTNHLSPEHANFVSSADHPYRPTKVGSYKANALGLHDMHGNVWQWCSSVYEFRGKNPVLVIRGGAYDQPAPNCSAASRTGRGPRGWYNNVGFRVARVPVP